LFYFSGFKNNCGTASPVKRPERSESATGQAKRRVFSQLWANSKHEMLSAFLVFYQKYAHLPCEKIA